MKKVFFFTAMSISLLSLLFAFIPKNKTKDNPKSNTYIVIAWNALF